LDAERTVERRLADDGEHWVIVERWLDRQVNPPVWRSKNRREKVKTLSKADRLYLESRG
jgi:hypothetical protein